MLPLQRIRHHFTLHHRRQSLNTISEAYFDFKDTKSVLPFKAQKRHSSQYLYYKKSWSHVPRQFLNSLVPSRAANGQTAAVLLQDYACSIQECSISVTSYWPDMKQAIQNKTGYSKYCYMHVHREKHCSTYHSQIPIIPYFRLVD